MSHLIIGTAGHVDHGKTMLVKTLTGVDTDRLKEEKERGISIELGFAPLLLPSGRRAGIVDVPGHERFIKNMLAGVGGIDMVLFVIAADEGIMPQTREHMDIIQLLGINKGVAVISKVDLVDQEWLELVEEDIREFLQGTPLKDAPVVKVSAVTGKGISELLQEIDNIASQVKEKPAAGKVRLPVDRVFSVTGFGTVTTGTLWSGVLHSGDALEVMPQGISVRVRSLQVHGKKVDEARAGQRVAVNITGVDVEQVPRGSILAQPGILKPSYRLDVRLLLLKSASKPLKHRARIRFYLGTAEILGRVLLLDREELKPGETTYAQILLEEAAVALKGDRFVIRSYSPMHTIGGGTVIDPLASRHKRMREEVLRMLAIREKGKPEELIEHILNNRATPLSIAELTSAANLSADETSKALLELCTEKKTKKITVDSQDYFVGDIVYQLWVKEIHRLVESYHKDFPLREGFPREELRSRKFPGLTTKQFHSLLKVMEEEGLFTLGTQTVALPGFHLQSDPAQQDLFQRLERTYREKSCQPPKWEEISREVGLNEAQAQEMLQYMLRQKILVKVSDDLYFHSTALEKARTLLIGYLQEKGEISVGEVRNLLQTSRKYALPLLEYFDRERVTKRVGDKRVAGKAC